MTTLLFKAIGRLPFGVLYAISSALLAPALSVFGYRRRVIRGNLEACFQDKSPQWRRGVMRRFYRNFADSIVETVKLLHISDSEMERRVSWENLGFIADHLAAGRSVAVYFSHCFNWEWAPSVTLNFPGKVYSEGEPPEGRYAFCQVYRPLRSAAFDALMLKIRSRFGAVSLPKETTLRSLIQFKRGGIPSVTGFMSDQHPSHGDPGHLTTLLGRPTLMITGTETLARRLDMAVAYWDIERTGRGRFRITTRPIADRASATAPGLITEAYTRMLEATILRDPANWLWSHNRWKHPITTSQ